MNLKLPKVAIVNYGMGNLFSVKRACENAGLEAIISSLPEEILKADGVVLPGVGAFGDAMKTLDHLNLIPALLQAAQSSKPFLGICLGMQLIMSESFEFGRHRGLGLIEGQVIRFEDSHFHEGSKKRKVPHIGWNKIYPSENVSWKGTLLKGLEDGTSVYFVHSYFVKLANPDYGVASTTYGETNFCSALNHQNIFACQFHPERSGPEGLLIFQNFARAIQQKIDERLELKYAG